MQEKFQVQFLNHALYVVQAVAPGIAPYFSVRTALENNLPCRGIPEELNPYEIAFVIAPDGPEVAVVHEKQACLPNA